MRRVIGALMAAACLAGMPGLVMADDDDDGGGPNHFVKVDNHADATRETRGGVQVASTGAKRVTSTNLAVARAHDCSGCQALAAAYQAVFVKREPSELSPRNLAIAVNENCTGCGSFAFAYQYVLDTNGPAHLTKEGRDQIDAIRAEARQDLEAGLPYDVLDAELRDLAARFRTVIDTEMRRTHTEVEDREADALVERDDD
jgi:hypothetical protein